MSLSFNQQLVLTLIDKALIGLLLLAAGHLLNSAVERRKASEELKKAIALERVAVYRQLWQITSRPLDAVSREEIITAFEGWYDAGGALFLSLNAAYRYFQALRMLRDKNTGEKPIRAELSWLRTELKHDCGIYGRNEADTQIPAAT
jgi:hypothetical protein